MNMFGLCSGKVVYAKTDKALGEAGISSLTFETVMLSTAKHLALAQDFRRLRG